MLICSLIFCTEVYQDKKGNSFRGMKRLTSKILCLENKTNLRYFAFTIIFYIYNKSCQINQYTCITRDNSRV